jgi:hypothetical protein
MNGTSMTGCDGLPLNKATEELLKIYRILKPKNFIHTTGLTVLPGLIWHKNGATTSSVIQNQKVQRNRNIPFGQQNS